MVVIQNTLNDSSINEKNLTNTLQQVIVELGYGESENHQFGKTCHFANHSYLCKSLLKYFTLNLTNTLQQVIVELGYGESELLIRLVDAAEIQLLNNMNNHQNAIFHQLDNFMKHSHSFAMTIFHKITNSAKLVILPFLIIASLPIRRFFGNAVESTSPIGW
jgi:S-adenosylmethionine synthetase